MHLTEFVQRFELILLPIMVDEKLVKDEDGFFVNNRFAIAQSAQRRGIEISVKVYEAGFGPLYWLVGSRPPPCKGRLRCPLA